LKALVEAARSHRLMMLLDVVYNYFGPEGAHVHAIAPETFSDRYKTQWGQAINFDGRDCRPIRAFVILNALYWIEPRHLIAVTNTYSTRFCSVHGPLS
jgi:maltooligosyltrehalose trehalohydrolase